MNILATAIKTLSAGNTVAFPTETVYGLGADCTNDDAVKQIFHLKQRPSFNPLIIHVANLEIARAYGIFNSTADHLAKTFWPGPLTLVLPLQPTALISPYVTAGLSTIAIRCPHHPVALELLSQYPAPIAAPSANKSGYISPTKYEHVYDEFGDTVLIIPGDPSCIGLESTIVDCSEDRPAILRPGFISKTDIERAAHRGVFEKESTEVIKAPGQLKQHYSPKLPVRLNVTHVYSNEALLNFGQNDLNAKFTLNLSPSGNLAEAAMNLFDRLRQLDKMGALSGVGGIAVAPIPNEGIGIAIQERLSRAAFKP